jgi:hypothetical protein
MSMTGISVVVHSTDRDAAVRRFELLLGTAPVREFGVEARGLTVTVFPGISVLSGPPDALGPVRDLRATIFVDSLAATRELLARTGWTTVGSLGSGASLLARDPDGALFEFVEVTAPPGGAGEGTS